VVSLIRKQLSGAVAVEYDGSDVILEQDGAISGATAKASCVDQLGGAWRILGTPSMDVVSIDGKFGCCRAVAGLEVSL
jgi:hypothetical protein